MQSAASKALALLLLVAALACLQGVSATLRRSSYRTVPYRYRRGTTWITAPKVEGCMEYSTFASGRYWTSKKYQYSTCGSRTLRGKYCVDVPVCEADKCGEGYKYNEYTGLCDCAEGYGLIPKEVYYKRLGGKQRDYCYPGVTKTGYYAPSSTSRGLYPDYTNSALGPVCSRRYWRSLMKRYGKRWNWQGYYPGHFMFKTGFYPVPKGGEMCKPCPEDYYSEGGPTGITWCVHKDQPPSEPSPPPPPPPPSPPPPSPPPPPRNCTVDDDCDINTEFCDNPSGEDGAGECVTLPPDSPPPDGDCNVDGCLNTTAFPVTFRACLGDGTCSETCSDPTECPSPLTCEGNRCVAGDAPDPVLELQNCASSACQTDSIDPFCFTYSGGARACVPCWMAPQNPCTTAGSTFCNLDGSCGSPDARKGPRKP